MRHDRDNAIVTCERPTILDLEDYRLPDLIKTSTLQSVSDDTSSPPTTPALENGSLFSTSTDAKHAPMSTGATLLYLIKGNLGAGLFAIPSAFKDAGLVGGSIGIPFVAALSIHCMHMLVKCSTVMKKRKGNTDMAMDYAEVLETACLTGPECLANWASFARGWMKAALFIKEMAFCSVFILFTATYLDQLMDYYFEELGWNVRHWVLVLSPVALVLGCVRNYRYIYPLSYVASFIKAASLVVLFVYISQDLPSVNQRPMFESPSTVLLFYGTVIFSFEGVTQVLPLHDNMRTTRHFRGLTGVLNTGMFIISCLYFAVGFYGYLKYGDETYPSITMNLPKDQLLSHIVKIGLIIALMIGYSLQFFAAVEMTQPTINSLYSCSWRRILAEMVVRVFIFSGSVGISLVVYNLDLYISLVGSFTCTFLCIVFPPLLDLITFWNKMSLSRLLKNVGIILFGVLAFAAGTAAGVLYLIDYFAHHHDEHISR